MQLNWNYNRIRNDYTLTEKINDMEIRVTFDEEGYSISLDKEDEKLFYVKGFKESIDIEKAEEKINSILSKIRENPKKYFFEEK